MPKDYITKLMFDMKHETIMLRNKSNELIGSICFRLFEEIKTVEIVFLAVSSNEQIKGFGKMIMNYFKNEMKRRGIVFILACADNLAIGYFRK